MTPGEQLDQVGERVTDLIRALDRLPMSNLVGMIEALRIHEVMVGELTPEFPGVVDVLAATPMRRAFLALVEQVLAFREENS
jgi:hypothetical protein